VHVRALSRSRRRTWFCPALKLTRLFACTWFGQLCSRLQHVVSAGPYGLPAPSLAPRARAQVGKTGRAVGIDVKRPAVVLSRRNLAALAAADADYAANAAPATFELHNAFTPSLKHQARARCACPLAGRVPCLQQHCAAHPSDPCHQHPLTARDAPGSLRPRAQRRFVPPEQAPDASGAAAAGRPAGAAPRPPPPARLRGGVAVFAVAVTEVMFELAPLCLQCTDPAPSGGRVQGVPACCARAPL